MAIVMLFAATGSAATTAPTSAPADPRITIHPIATEYQKGPTEIRVLLPDSFDPTKKYRVLYVLPVYANAKPAAAAINQALAENLHNRFDLICVTPSFDTIPWYFDDPADPRIRQDAYMVNAVVPFVEAKYPAAIREPRGRLLVGFSKSGWGAFTLLLRHPDVFGRAASWDAPLMAGRGGSYKPPAIMGSPDNFAKFCVVDLLEQRAEMLRTQPARLAVFGHGIFKEDDVLAHERMTKLDIPHLWDHGPERKHGWTSGWLTPAVEALVRDDLASTQPTTRPTP